MIVMLIALASHAASAQSTFRITQVFSSLDGVWQFVELTESAGLNGQHHLTGLTLTSTSSSGLSKKFTFRSDLSTEDTAHVSIIVSTAENEWFDWWMQIPPTLLPYYPGGSLPQRFVPTDGGTLDFAGVDSVTYATLPTDGMKALYRDWSVRHATIPFYCTMPPCERYETSRTMVGAWEYYNAALDRYFITASAPDIDALESGRLPGWVPTGQEFGVSSVGDFPVCRFYIPPAEGDSHFFSASIVECEAVRVRFPDFILETPSAFYVPLPAPATGACPPDDGSGVYAVPVYRLWNQRADSNHRYTASESIRDEMLQRGYVDEGIAWCYWTSVWGY